MDRYKFVFISHCKDIDFFNPVKKGIADAAGLLNVDISFVGTEDINIAEQKSLLKNAIENKVDGIATTITHPTEFNSLIKNAVKNNIPVVCFNTDASNGTGGQLSSVVQDTYNAGYRLGEFMSEYIFTGDSVLLTLHSEGVNSLEMRKKGIMESLKDKNINWTFLTTGNGADEAYSRISKVLTADNKIKFVFGTGQDDTEGAGRAVVSLGASKSVIVGGFDLADNTKVMIDTGDIKAVVDQQPYMQGFYPVMQLYHYNENGLLPSNIDAGSRIVTR